MRLDALRQLALSLPGTTEVNQWGGLVFKVVEKVFLLLVVEADTLEGVVVKVRPEDFDQLTEIEGIDQAPYFAKRHWIRISDLTALDGRELDRRVRESYELVVGGLPKKTQAALRR